VKTLILYNTDGRKLQEFVPLRPGKVGLYCCGPTVYNYVHIGNLRPYTHWDILKRSLERFGYQVTHVMNITDVGHLTDDGDQGEDKMLKGARERGMTVWDIANFFTEAFIKDIRQLNIRQPTIACKATEHIPDMLGMVETLTEKGFAYQAGGNVYFDSSKLPDYGRMALLERQVDKQNQQAARVELDANKRNPMDFVLWFTKSKFENQAMLWDSPWGRGYPGWHLECSAMSSRYLGEYIDIHTGGVDHIPVHHTNEIAQSEAAFGHRWVNYWLHNEFLIMKNDKMSKSDGGFLTLNHLLENGYHPLDYRYFLLGAHYRSQLVFSDESLDAAQSARKSLNGRIASFGRESNGEEFPSMNKLSEKAHSRLSAFDEALCDDQNTPRALAELWQLVKDEDISPAERLTAALNMDSILGLGLADIASEGAPSIEPALTQLIERREIARASQDWETADRIRDELAALGWKVVDTAEGPHLKKA